MTEKLKPCPFCTSTRKPLEINENTGVQIIDCRDGKFYLQMYSTGTRIDLPINNCPNCGRLLQYNTLMADENPPLTLEELRKMNGESVLTITDTDAIDILQRKLIGGRLATVKLQRHMYLDVHEDVVDYGDGTCRILDWKYGKTWLAYKRKPEV